MEFVVRMLMMTMARSPRQVEASRSLVSADDYEMVVISV
jgi:hypothetical protein